MPERAREELEAHAGVVVREQDGVRVIYCLPGALVTGARGSNKPDLCLKEEQMPTREEIEAARTPRGAWTKAQLARWGVPWPPPKGWKREVEQRSQSLGTVACPECGRQVPVRVHCIELPGERREPGASAA